MGNTIDEEEATSQIDSQMENDAFLIEVVRRGTLLSALKSEPASSSELASRVDLSRSTIHRATDSLAERDLIEKSDGTFRLTTYGEVVAEELIDFRELMAAIRLLKPFLSYVDVPNFPIEDFIDAVVIEPKPRQPHYTVHNIMKLIEETEYLRAFSSVISPFYVDIARREMLNGMRAEAIFDVETMDIILSEYNEPTEETIQTGRFDVYVHDEIPFELFIFDEKIGLAAHDENGIARVLVVSSSPGAINWGEQLYEEYLAEARPLHTSS